VNRAGVFDDFPAKGVVFVAGERGRAVLDSYQPVPGVVDEGVALVVGREVAVVIEGERRGAGGGFFVLLVERVAGRAAAVGGSAGKVGERIERRGGRVRRAGDRVVAGVQGSASKRD